MSIPANAPSVLDTTLGNDGFWPLLPVRKVVSAHRLQFDSRDGALTTVLVEAMIEANDALAAAKAKLRADGYATLADYMTAHNETIGGEPVLVSLYLSAVGYWAKAAEIERRGGVERRPMAEADVDGQAKTAAGFLDQFQRTVTRIQQRVLGQGGSADYGFHVASIGE